MGSGLTYDAAKISVFAHYARFARGRSHIMYIGKRMRYVIPNVHVFCLLSSSGLMVRMPFSFHVLHFQETE